MLLFHAFLWVFCHLCPLRSSKVMLKILSGCQGNRKWIDCLMVIYKKDYSSSSSFKLDRVSKISSSKSFRLVLSDSFSKNLPVFSIFSRVGPSRIHSTNRVMTVYFVKQWTHCTRLIVILFTSLHRKISVSLLAQSGQGITCNCFLPALLLPDAAFFSRRSCLTMSAISWITMNRE